MSVLGLYGQELSSHKEAAKIMLEYKDKYLFYTVLTFTS